MSRNCPFSGRLLEPITTAFRSVHKTRPAIVFRPKMVHHVSETVSILGLFTPGVVCMTTDAMTSTYKPGALAVAHPAPKDVNSLSEVPADAVGGFVYEGGPIALTDIRTRGVRYAGPVGVEIQGWLKAREAGRYQIGTDLSAHFGVGTMFAPTCLLQAWLEGRSLNQRSVLVSHPGSNDANASLVLGADLQPGLYRLRV